MEIMAEIIPGKIKPSGIKVRKSEKGEEETVIYHDPRNKQLVIDVEKSTLDKSIVYHKFVQNYDGKGDTPPKKDNTLLTSQKAPFLLKEGETLNFRIFLDKTILEVFANNRLCMTQRVYPVLLDSDRIELFSKDSDTLFKSIKAWDMHPIEVTDQ